MSMEHNKEKCSVCGKCVDECPVEARKINDKGELEIDPGTCVNCKKCTEICEANEIPEDQISKVQDGA